MKRLLVVIFILFVFSITGFWIGGFDFIAKVTTDVANESPVGDVPEILLDINSVEKVKCLGDCEIAKSKTGYSYVVLDFTITNLSPRDYLFNPLSMKIRDVNGYAYRHSFLGTELDTYFSVVTLSPGTLASGSLAYELPTGSSGLQVELDSYLGKPLQSITLADG